MLPLRSRIGIQLAPDRYERLLVGAHTVRLQACDGTVYEGQFHPKVGAVKNDAGCMYEGAFRGPGVIGIVRPQYTPPSWVSANVWVFKRGKWILAASPQLAVGGDGVFGSTAEGKLSARYQHRQLMLRFHSRTRRPLSVTFFVRLGDRWIEIGTCKNGYREKR